MKIRHWKYPIDVGNFHFFGIILQSQLFLRQWRWGPDLRKFYENYGNNCRSMFMARALRVMCEPL
jgi:hypothetical protein